MGTGAGKVMAVGRCGVSFDCFLSSQLRERIAGEVLEVWETKEEKEYSFGEWETEDGLGKYNLDVRKQQGPAWSLQS